MKVYILGICGTFMGSLAILAKQLGHEVRGCDENVYPPMSDILIKAGVQLDEGFDEVGLKQFSPDHVIVGNVMKRGHAVLEYVLQEKLDMYSGPDWLHQHILKHKKVISVCGTHGKTTTTSMACHMLEANGLNPSFLIGGVPLNFGVSSRLTDSEVFVIEADEYDTSFFDKRAKLVHYFPDIAIINNIEFDHADIYSDIQQIITQFHHMVRAMPSNGVLITGDDSDAMRELIAEGVWSQHIASSDDWSVHYDEADKKFFCQQQSTQKSYYLPSNILGKHNAKNALMAAMACAQAGVSFEKAIQSLETFQGSKRRLEVIFENKDLIVYDDFAHHPTAIQAVLETIRTLHPEKVIHAVIQFGSNSMRNGAHAGHMVDAVKDAHHVYCQEVHAGGWSLEDEFQSIAEKVSIVGETNELLNTVTAALAPNEVIVIMRNSSFDQFDQKLVSALSKQKVAVS